YARRHREVVVRDLAVDLREKHDAAVRRRESRVSQVLAPLLTVPVPYPHRLLHERGGLPGVFLDHDEVVADLLQTRPRINLCVSHLHLSPCQARSRAPASFLAEPPGTTT